jgi:hypothetical protein
MYIGAVTADAQLEASGQPVGGTDRRPRTTKTGGNSGKHPRPARRRALSKPSWVFIGIADASPATRYCEIVDETPLAYPINDLEAIAIDRLNTAQWRVFGYTVFAVSSVAARCQNLRLEHIQGIVVQLPDLYCSQLMVIG